jgi:hypothetical protein
MPLEYRTCECLAIPGDAIRQALLFAGQMTNVARPQIPALMLSAMHMALSLSFDAACDQGPLASGS